MNRRMSQCAGAGKRTTPVHTIARKISFTVGVPVQRGGPGPPAEIVAPVAMAIDRPVLNGNLLLEVLSFLVFMRPTSLEQTVLMHAPDVPDRLVL